MKKIIYFLGFFAVIQLFGYCYSQSDREFHKLQANFTSKYGHGLNINFRHKADPWLDTLKRLSEKNPVKYGIYYKNALVARKQTDTIFNYLQSVKEAIASRSGGWADSTKESVMDHLNIDVPGQYFLKEKHGFMMRDSLKRHITEMLNVVPIEFKNSFKIWIDISDPPLSTDSVQKSWEEYYWEGVPSIAALTELGKFQYDVQFTEGDVIMVNYKCAKNK